MVGYPMAFMKTGASKISGPNRFFKPYRQTGLCGKLLRLLASV
jgi:hypothetical protein